MSEVPLYLAARVTRAVPLAAVLLALDFALFMYLFKSVLR